jgi:hypothetical protein
MAREAICRIIATQPQRHPVNQGAEESGSIQFRGIEES